MAELCGCAHSHIVWSTSHQTNICDRCKAVEVFTETIYCPSCKIRTHQFTKYRPPEAPITDFYQCGHCNTCIFITTATPKVHRRWEPRKIVGDMFTER